MTHDERLIMLEAMKQYGGSFAKAIAAAWTLADATNCRKLEECFPELIEKYGPKSAFYEGTQRQ